MKLRPFVCSKFAQCWSFLQSALVVVPSLQNASIGPIVLATLYILITPHLVSNNWIGISIQKLGNVVFVCLQTQSQKVSNFIYHFKSCLTCRNDGHKCFSFAPIIFCSFQHFNGTNLVSPSTFDVIALVLCY